MGRGDERGKKNQRRNHTVFCKKDYINTLLTFLAEKQTHSTRVDWILYFASNQKYLLASQKRKLQWKSNMPHTLFVAAWPFFLLACSIIYPRLSLLKWYTWLWGLVKPDWCGQATLKLFMCHWLFLCPYGGKKQCLVFIFRRLWFTTYQMNYWNCNTKEHSTTCY